MHCFDCGREWGILIKEVTYYQAVCDSCGLVDDQGEYTAWSERDHARLSAVEAEWLVLTEANGNEFLVCELGCRGEGADWCKTCDDELRNDGWKVRIPGTISQLCPNEHLNTIKRHQHG